MRMIRWNPIYRFPGRCLGVMLCLFAGSGAGAREAYGRTGGAPTLVVLYTGNTHGRLEACD